MTGMDRPPFRQVPEDLEDLDPGLARERGSLAWRRTAVSFTAVSLAVLKFTPLAGAPLLLMAVSMWALGSAHMRTGLRSLRGTAQRRAIGAIALATAVTAVIALIVALLGSGRNQ